MGMIALLPRAPRKAGGSLGLRSDSSSLSVVPIKSPDIGATRCEVRLLVRGSFFRLVFVSERFVGRLSVVRTMRGDGSCRKTLPFVQLCFEIYIASIEEQLVEFLSV